MSSLKNGFSQSKLTEELVGIDYIHEKFSIFFTNFHEYSQISSDWM